MQAGGQQAKPALCCCIDQFADPDQFADHNDLNIGKVLDGEPASKALVRFAKPKATILDLLSRLILKMADCVMLQKAAAQAT